MTPTEANDTSLELDACFEQKRGALECLLFVAGEPVALLQLAKALSLSETALCLLIDDTDAAYEREGRGFRLLRTEQSVQMLSNRVYIDYVEALLQPDETRSASRSILETLSIIAYRQPITRVEIEELRGVRCEYALSQLNKLGLITPQGRKDCPGRPLLYGTTDAFLRRFGLHSLRELPPLPSDPPAELPIV